MSEKISVEELNKIIDDLMNVVVELKQLRSKMFPLPDREPSEKQLNYLRRLDPKADLNEWKKKTMREVSKRIDELLAQKRASGGERDGLRQPGG